MPSDPSSTSISDSSHSSISSRFTNHNSNDLVHESCLLIKPQSVALSSPPYLHSNPLIFAGRYALIIRHRSRIDSLYELFVFPFVCLPCRCWLLCIEIHSLYQELVPTPASAEQDAFSPAGCVGPILSFISIITASLTGQLHGVHTAHIRNIFREDPHIKASKNPHVDGRKIQRT